MDDIEYYKALARHDWAYMMSDDPKVYSQGSRESQELIFQASLTPERQDAYNTARKSFWGK